jgi:hypothetical protein
MYGKEYSALADCLFVLQDKHVFAKMNAKINEKLQIPTETI